MRQNPLSLTCGSLASVHFCNWWVTWITNEEFLIASLAVFSSFVGCQWWLLFAVYDRGFHRVCEQEKAWKCSRKSYWNAGYERDVQSPYWSVLLQYWYVCLCFIFIKMTPFNHLFVHFHRTNQHFPRCTSDRQWTYSIVVSPRSPLQ